MAGASRASSTSAGAPNRARAASSGVQPTPVALSLTPTRNSLEYSKLVERKIRADEETARARRLAQAKAEGMVEMGAMEASKVS